MSSPLSMLKKTRRAPLQAAVDDHWDGHKVPFRRNLFKECQSALSDQTDPSDPSSPGPSHTGNALTSGQVRTKVPFKKAAPPSDFELMSSMMQRVTMLEKKVTMQAQELQRKEKNISDLEEKLRLQKESEGANTPSREDPEGRCRRLQNQVHEMESFLNDYGLIWVGDETSGDSAEYASVRTFNMNFDLVLQRIRELNVLAGEGESVVRTTATGAQLTRRDLVHLRLYSNGIVMFDGPFRSYEDRSTQQCMQDLMDGYFPSELQQRFPDGVPLEVHDRRHEEFIVRRPWSKFPGEGRAVDSTRVSMSQIPDKKLTTHQFLNRLPKVVVTAGRVTDVRGSLRATLQGSTEAQSSDSLIVVDTPALHAVTESSAPPSSPHNIITLKVKSEDGSHTYILKMSLSETIGHLRRYLDKHRRGDLLDYDIISKYPHCCYSDDYNTLQSCGLSTNAFLLLQKRKPAHLLTEFNKINP